MTYGYDAYEDHYAPPATMGETASYYHRVLGENCPWDCAACPGNIAAAEYEAAETEAMEAARLAARTPEEVAADEAIAAETEAYRARMRAADEVPF